MNGETTTQPEQATEIQQAREHTAPIRRLFEIMQSRVKTAREMGRDPEQRLPFIGQGMISANEVLWELRIAKMVGGRYEFMQTAKALGDALGAHVGGLGLPSVRRGGVRYFILDGQGQALTSTARPSATDAPIADAAHEGNE